MIVELTRRSACGIYAVPYHRRRARRAVRLPDGAMVELIPPGGSADLPRSFPSCYEPKGYPDIFVGHTGAFVLPSGEVGIVYGAEMKPLDERP